MLLFSGSKNTDLELEIEPHRKHPLLMHSEYVQGSDRNFFDERIQIGRLGSSDF